MMGDEPAEHGFSAMLHIRTFGHWPDLVKRAGARWGMTASQYVRSAVLAALERDGFDIMPPDTDPELKRQAPAARAALTLRQIPVSESGEAA